ncbi:MAG: hypothetical protein QM760_09040 [Nibricoccus sp.]
MTPRQFAGRFLYRAYHAPVGAVRNFLSGGGPFEQRRTEAGRREMEDAAALLPPPISASSTAPLVVHLLTGNRFWYQTAFCLHTFATHSGRSLAPAIYDDGSLTAAQRESLARIFPLTHFVSRGETVSRLDALLPRERFPVLRERWENYPNIRKLTDPHLGSHGWKLVLDSDLLFFRTPDLLVRWLDAPATPLHAVDVQRSYGYSDALLASLASAPLADRLNVGLCGLNSDELDWEKLEWFCHTLIERERTHYYLEQALVAVLLAGRDCTVASAGDYLTLPRPPEAHECRAIMHHYVADSKRWYFQNNWRRCVPSASSSVSPA